MGHSGVTVSASLALPVSARWASAGQATRAHRALCLRCRRPARVCYCAHIPSLQTRTHLVFLQHVRERRMPIGTARMAHLALPNSEFHVGIDFAGNERVSALVSEPGTFLLFPGPNARDLRDLREGELKSLIVVDGTWPLAKKLIRVNPALSRLPQLSFRPSRPGNYRIRKEPAEHCVATIEAVAEVLGVLEGDPERFQRMLRAFDAMVNTQLRLRAERTGPSRYATVRPKPKKPPERVRVAESLRALGESLVLVYAESNPVKVSETERRQELLHLVASRPSTGERFEALMRPGAELAPSAPHHLELDAQEILAGEPRDVALARWRAFLRTGDVFAGWGYYAWALIKPELEEGATFIDLRERLIRVVRKKLGGLDEAAGVTATDCFAGARGRAGRRLIALERVLERLLAPAADPE
ncbi:MAG: DTW domain-containing protein [Myxococcaceae bacterium]|nr:DTW domain-containing protein [Myxococcaceae bacterium]